MEYTRDDHGWAARRGSDRRPRRRAVLVERVASSSRRRISNLRSLRPRPCSSSCRHRRGPPPNLESPKLAPTALVVERVTSSSRCRISNLRSAPKPSPRGDRMMRPLRATPAAPREASELKGHSVSVPRFRFPPPCRAALPRRSRGSRKARAPLLPWFEVSTVTV